ncbi:MAG: protein-disulfide reductase DsbD [Propionivibrio sp.]
MMLRVLLVLIFWCQAAAAFQPLPPQLAFKPQVRAIDARTLEVRFEITRGYYLYGDKFRFQLDAEGAALGAPRLPKGKSVEDATFGRVDVYYDRVRLTLPVERPPGEALAATLHITSQGCAEAGVCYPPLRQSLPVELPPAGAVTASAGLGGDESGTIGRWLGEAAPWLVVVSFFGFGLLLAFTPCVFPMLPIVSGIIVGAGTQVTPRRGLLLSLAYVFGMAVAYAAAGVAAGLSGTLLAAALQNAWVLGGMAVLFVALALSMFGVYELQLPSAWQSQVTEEAGHFRAGSLPGVAAMGAVSALVVGPCVAAPLAGALLYIGQTGDALLGGVALFFMALGMGVPLVAVGASAGALLPRAGAWMDGVKKAFGVALLATAWSLLAPVLPPAFYLGGWAVLCIVTAIWLRAIDPLPVHAPAGLRVLKGVAVVLLLVGCVQLVGAFSGASDPWRPLAGLRATEAAPKLPFERVRTLAELEARISAAGRPVLVDYYADWCVACKDMERSTFADDRVRQRLAGWTLLQVDVTANSDDDKALLARFGLFGPPGIVFFDARGVEVPNVRVVGFQSADAFLRTLALAAP